MESSFIPIPVGRRFAGTFLAKALLLGSVTAVVLALTHTALLFVNPWHEHSDYAINALQIERAGHFREIYGNQSRFGFYHPGPAYFYVYAAGEKVLFDWLGLVPSPFNAHLIAGLVLQTCFFSVALTIAADWVRRPLFVPLALLAAAVHFGFVGSAFVDIWPPRVLLMPFLCLLVAGASVAAGRVRDLPALTLSGCMLVHGHVAQPLFVVPVFVCAYGLLCLRAVRSEEGWRPWFRQSKRTHVVSLTCIAVFLVPLVIDLLGGAQSNFARIIGFTQFHQGYAASLWRSALYFAGFFCYLRTPEEFLSAGGPGRADFIAEHPGAYFAWAVFIVIGVIYLARVFLQKTADHRWFALSFGGFIVLSCLVCLRWGSAQLGGMFEYNGYFYYALLYAMLLVTCAALSAVVVPAPGLARVVLWSAALATVWFNRQPSPIDYSTNDIPAAVQSALRADPATGTTKYLLFGYSNWGEAASTGLALKRSGNTFVGDSDWGQRFGRDATFEPMPPDFDLRGHSIWRISYLGPEKLGRVFRDDLKLYFGALPLDPADSEIDGGIDRNLELYALFGFAASDGSATWTIRPYAGLIFQAPLVSHPIDVAITADPAVAPNEEIAQPMTLIVNGQRVFDCTLRAPGTVNALVPAEVWNLRSPVLMVLHLPNAIPPEKYGPPTEHRTLGWHIQKIRFHALR